jgi:hypothetical protein
VLDPFCGCGSTLVAAKELGRVYVGIEIEGAHCQTAVGRLEPTAQTLLGMVESVASRRLFDQCHMSIIVTHDEIPNGLTSIGRGAKRRSRNLRRQALDLDDRPAGGVSASETGHDSDSAFPADRCGLNRHSVLRSVLGGNR